MQKIQQTRLTRLNFYSAHIFFSSHAFFFDQQKRNEFKRVQRDYGAHPIVNSRKWNSKPSWSICRYMHWFMLPERCITAMHKPSVWFAMLAWKLPERISCYQRWRLHIATIARPQEWYLYWQCRCDCWGRETMGKPRRSNINPQPCTAWELEGNKLHLWHSVRDLSDLGCFDVRAWFFTVLVDSSCEVTLAQRTGQVQEDVSARKSCCQP